MIRVLGPRKKLLVVSRTVLINALSGLDISVKELEALVICDMSPVLPQRYNAISKNLIRRALMQRSRAGYFFLTIAGESVLDIAKKRIKYAVHCIPQYKNVHIRDMAIDISPTFCIQLTFTNTDGTRRKESS